MSRGAELEGLLTFEADFMDPGWPQVPDFLPLVPRLDERVFGLTDLPFGMRGPSTAQTGCFLTLSFRELKQTNKQTSHSTHLPQFLGVASLVSRAWRDEQLAQTGHTKAPGFA